MSEKSVEQLMGIGSEQSIFPSTSRYYGVGSKTMKTADDREVKYLKRRFCPQPEKLSPLYEHRVRQNDRLDRISAHYLGDPTLFWRICDANAALRPGDLLENVSDRLIIALPEGMS